MYDKREDWEHNIGPMVTGLLDHAEGLKFKLAKQASSEIDKAVLSRLDEVIKDGSEALNRIRRGLSQPPRRMLFIFLKAIYRFSASMMPPMAQLIAPLMAPRYFTRLMSLDEQFSAIRLGRNGELNKLHDILAEIRMTLGEIR